MLNHYPDVLGEVQTLDRVLKGHSISRFGDGELKMASHDAGIKSQNSDTQLSARLREILTDSGDCLVGLPNIREVIKQQVSDQKVEHWARYMRFKWLLAERTYVSAFITRPDSAPWINTPDYWAAIESLWLHRDVTLVRGSTKSLVAEDLVGARSVREIVAPRQHAWGEYASLMDRIGTPERALLCLGPTATVMAVDLCAKGVHAIDLGHIGMFRRKWLKGVSMDVTAEDRFAK